MGMEYRTLGRTGLQVSKLCFGAMSFGSDADEATSAQMFHRCREAGINFFDTADVYSGGRSETILGSLIQGSRDEIVLASKVGWPNSAAPNAGGTSRRRIRLQVESSLKRLQTDYLDIYFLHTFDPRTEMEDALRGLDDVIRQGKVVYAGVSNWAAWQIALALGKSALDGLARFECIQPQYNLLKRQAEVEILPLAQSEQMGVIAYSPLAAGYLSGKYGVGRRPEQGRVKDSRMYELRYGRTEYDEIADRFTAHAQERGVHPVSLAVAWVAEHPSMTAPIIGARNLEQLQPALDAVNINLTPEWRAEISALSVEPPPATDRLEEQKGMIPFK